MIALKPCVPENVNEAVPLIYASGPDAFEYVFKNDKVSAQDGSQRTPENTLHLISLMGGWPGAIFAQQKFRHKTKKFSFLVLFWLTVVANCAGFLWLLTAKGLNFISNLLVSFT